MGYLVLLMPAFSLLATYFFARRRPRINAQPGASLEPDPLRVGIAFWFVALALLIVVPLLDLPYHRRLWYLPSLSPADPRNAWSSGNFFYVIGAFVITWLFGAPLAATAGLRTALLAAVIVCSAGIVAGHAALIAPDLLDELAIPVVALLHLLLVLKRGTQEQIAISTTCQSCGYDLSPTPDAPCPECGIAYDKAIAVHAHRLAISPAGARAAQGWAIGALAVMCCGPVGLAAAIARHLVHGVDWSSSIQLAQQYEGNAAAPIVTAVPMAIAAGLTILLSPLPRLRRVWLLIPLGVAASFALRLFV